MLLTAFGEQRRSGPSKVFSPTIRQTPSKRLATYGICRLLLQQSNRISSVVVLFDPGCPTTIIRPVTFGIVNSVDRVHRSHPLCPFRTAPHICNKVRVITPSVAHSNSTCAVIRVQSVVRVTASGQYVSPDLVLRRLSSVSSFPVSKVDSGAMTFATFNSIASTRRRRPLTQSSPHNISFGTAVTSTVPGYLPMLPTGFVQYKPTSKSLIGQIYSSHMSNIMRSRQKVKR